MIPRARAGAPLPWPAGTLGLALSLALAHALEVRARAQTGLGPEALPERWVLDGRGPRAWQYLSYAFVHGDAVHLGVNVAALAVAGALLERRIGAARVITLFLLQCALVGLGFHLSDPRDLYGASGAVAGCAVSAAIVWLCARDAAWPARTLPALGATGYLLWTDGLAALRGYPSPGWRPHAIGVVSGLVVGSAVARWRGRRSVEGDAAARPSPADSPMSST